MKGFLYKLTYFLSVFTTALCVGVLTTHLVGLVELAVDNNVSRMHVIAEDKDGSEVDIVFQTNLHAVYHDIGFSILMMVGMVGLCVVGIKLLRVEELEEQKKEESASDNYVKLDDPILESV
jgi:hypothetical protein